MKPEAHMSLYCHLHSLHAIKTIFKEKNILIIFKYSPSCVKLEPIKLDLNIIMGYTEWQKEKVEQ